MQFSSSDGNAVLYFNLVTKQIWGEELGDESNCSMNVDTDGRETFGEQPLAGQDPPMEDFSDDDINAAARIIRTVSPLYFRFIENITEWPLVSVRSFCNTIGTAAKSPPPT